MKTGNQERNEDRVKYLIERLRYITLAVQIAPFIYSLLLIFCLTLHLFCSGPILRVLNNLFYVSPIVIVSFLVESKILKLCKWHKTACAIPLIPQALVAVDRYIIEFTEAEAYIAIITPIVLAILLLIAAYHVFIK